MKRSVALVKSLMAAALVLAAAPLPAAPAPPMPPPLPPLREQDRIRQQWLETRLSTVLPALMRKHGVEMWLVVCREYNEDPVFFSLVAPSVMAARRRTILVFHDRGDRVDRLALGGGGSAGLYQIYRDPSVENRELWGQGQWALLRKLVDERKPKTIAVDVSQTHAFSDGLSVGEWEQLAAALGPWTSRVIRAEGLALDYMDTRVPEVPSTDADPLFPPPDSDMPDATPLDALNGSIEDAVPAPPVFGRPTVSPDGATVAIIQPDQTGANRIWTCPPADTGTLSRPSPITAPGATAHRYAPRRDRGPRGY